MTENNDGETTEFETINRPEGAGCPAGKRITAEFSAAVPGRGTGGPRGTGCPIDRHRKERKRRACSSADSPGGGRGAGSGREEIPPARPRRQRLDAGTGGVRQASVRLESTAPFHAGKSAEWRFSIPVQGVQPRPASRMTAQRKSACPAYPVRFSAGCGTPGAEKCNPARQPSLLFAKKSSFLLRFPLQFRESGSILRKVINFGTRHEIQHHNQCETGNRRASPGCRRRLRPSAASTYSRRPRLSRLQASFSSSCIPVRPA